MEPTQLYQLFAKHFAAWTSADVQRRQELIEEVYTPDLEVVDAYFALTGREHLSPFIDNLQRKFPGCQFSLTRPLEHHHDITRAFWQLGLPGQAPVSTGQDVLLTKGGRVHKLYVFIDGVNVIQETI